MEIVLKEDERVDDLQFKGLKIIQDTKKFCFGMDAVLLSHFVEIRKKDRAVDLGTGTGIIPLLMSGRMDDFQITGVEIQQDMVELANRSVQMNNLSARVKIVCGDIRDCFSQLGKGRYTLVVSNPPYKKTGSGIVNPDDAKAFARHEILCTLEDVLKAAAELLISGGRFVMIHQTDRLMDILYGMRSIKLEPKRIRLVHPNAEKPPNLVLIEGVKGGRPHLKWLPPLFIYDEKGSYTNELLSIYNGDCENNEPTREEF